MRHAAAFVLTAAALLGVAAPSAHAADVVAAVPVAAPTVHAWKTPNLTAGYTPQGMTVWGSRVVMAEYRTGSNSRLVAVNPATGKTYGQVSIAATHAGGIAIVGQWLFVENAATTGSDAVRRYRLVDFTAAMAKSHAAAAHPVYVHAAGLQQLAPWQFMSFAATDGVLLYAGHHGVGAGARMYTYAVDPVTGLLSALPGYVMIPENAQGMAPVGGVAVYTCGGGRLIVGGVTLSMPTHAQGVVAVRGALYVAREGGAHYVLRVALPTP